MDLISDGLKL